MILVLATAISTWVLMVLMDTFDFGGFLLESTIAVLGGAAVGFFAAWIIRRRRRQGA